MPARHRILSFNGKHVDVFEDDPRFGPVRIAAVDHPRAGSQLLAEVSLAESPPIQSGPDI